MSTRVARVIRGLVVASISLLVASAAHLSGGGQIGEVGFVLAAIFSVFVSIGLTGRTVSRLRIALSVMLSQGAFHLLFGIGAGYRASATVAVPGMEMPGMAQLPDPTLATAAATPTATMPDSGWMWLAHGIAALITIVALLRGEKTFWELTGRLTLALTRVFFSPEPNPVPRRQPTHIATEVDKLGTRFLLAGLRHRGPPTFPASG